MAGTRTPVSGSWRATYYDGMEFKGAPFVRTTHGTLNLDGKLKHLPERITFGRIDWTKSNSDTDKQNEVKSYLKMKIDEGVENMMTPFSGQVSMYAYWRDDNAQGVIQTMVSARYQLDVQGPGDLVITDESSVVENDGGLRILIDGMLVRQQPAAQPKKDDKKKDKNPAPDNEIKRELSPGTHSITVEYWKGSNESAPFKCVVKVEIEKPDEKKKKEIEQSWKAVNASVRTDLGKKQGGHLTRGRLEPARIYPADEKGNPLLGASRKYNIFYCQINPYKYSIQKKAKWKFGGDHPITENHNYAHEYETDKVEPAKLTINELYFDTSEERGANGKQKSVREYTDRLSEFAESESAKDIAMGLKAAINSPPRIGFKWGPVMFLGFIEQLKIKFILFDKDGTPLRAKVTLTMKEYRMRRAYPRQNPTSGDSPHTRVWRVTTGDRLDTIAAEVYGDANQWRRIAAHNEIVDPLVIQAGQTLLLPA